MRKVNDYKRNALIITKQGAAIQKQVTLIQTMRNWGLGGLQLHVNYLCSKVRKYVKFYIFNSIRLSRAQIWGLFSWFLEFVVVAWARAFESY